LKVDKTKKKRSQFSKQLTITKRQLQFLKYRAAGLSLGEIARKTHTSSADVACSLKKIEKVYPSIRSIVTEIERQNLIEKMHKHKLASAAAKEPAFMHAMAEKVRQGYFIGVTPKGYRKEKGRLMQTEEAPMIKQIYEEMDKDPNITLGQLAKKFEIGRSQIMYVLSNPIYKGYIRYRGILYKGIHEPIVSEELWNRVQDKVANRRYGQRSLPLGYKYEKGRAIIDPVTAPKIKEMFRLRVAGLEFSEIRRRLNMKHPAVVERIKNPYYANKKFVGGKWVDDDHEAIIDFETWKAANRPPLKKPWEKAVGLRKEVKRQNKNKILACLGSSEKTLGEIAKETGLSKATVYKQLKSMEGVSTEKNPPGRRKGKWRICM